MAASLLVLAHLNSLLLPAKIDLSQLPHLLLPHFAMQPVNQRSCIAVKEISESVLQLQSVYLDFATLYQSVQHSQCRRVLLHKF
jgi:hypothetical protein